MLIIKRRIDESITIRPRDGTDASQTIDELFAAGVIEIKLLDVGSNKVTIAIDAPPELKIWRGHEGGERSRVSPSSSPSTPPGRRTISGQRG